MVDAPAGLLFSQDLLWTSKIVETARALGRPIRAVRSADELVALAGTAAPRLVVLDLETRGIDVGALAERVRQAAPAARLVAFGRHTDLAGLEAARQAGCQPVLARSALQARLGESLAEWLA